MNPVEIYLGILIALLVFLLLVVFFRVVKNRSESKIALLGQENYVCRVCLSVPNDFGHVCSLHLEIEKTWAPSADTFARSDFFNLSSALGKSYSQTEYRYIDNVMHGNSQLRNCSKIHRSSHEAVICGQVLIRNLQFGEYVVLLADSNLNFVNGGQTPRGTITNFSEDVWAHIILMHDCRCFYCGNPGDTTTFHNEHRIPLSRGGLNHVKNIVPACQSCNLSKGTYTDDEFLEIRLEKFRSKKIDNGSGLRSFSLDPLDFSIMNWNGLPRNHYKVSELNLKAIEFLIPMTTNNADWGEIPIKENDGLAEIPLADSSSTLFVIRVQDFKRPTSDETLFRLFLKRPNRDGRNKSQYHFLYSVLQSELIPLYEAVANGSSVYICDFNGVETSYVHLGKTLYRPWFSQIR